MTGYRFTDNLLTPVVPDGQFGELTVKALQFGLGYAKQDGVFGAATIKSLQNLIHTTWKLPVGAFGVFDMGTVKSLQKIVAVTQDGAFGPATATALQLALDDGTLGGPGTGAPGSYLKAHPLPTTPPVVATQGEIDQSQVTYGHYSGGGSIDDWIEEACAATGRPYNSAWRIGYETIATRESSDDPNAVNDYDLNAVGAIVADGYPFQCSRGVVQCIPPTFATYHAAGTSTDIYDPVANIAASMNYVKAVYGVSDDGSNLASNVEQANPNEAPRGY
jgi:Transglycosylase SLT domain